MSEQELTKIVNEICKNTFYIDDKIVKNKNRDENELCISFSKLKEILSKYAFCKSNPDDWIPVEERLPEEKGVYLVTYHPCYWDDVESEIKVGIDTFMGKTAWSKRKFQRVIAWRLLPKPYSPEPLETRKELEEDSKGVRKNE